MKLIRCEIENFGKLSNFSMDFTDGLNVICEENGWGKSTLASFIKIMFYGFDNERARKDEVSNERKRFKPWQGGTYGGKIVFSVDDKCYEMTRIFGTKDKDDVFELRDVKTNLLVEDYSVNIGEELFEIDSTSFARTIYISQNSCETMATGSINAKIGNLAENTDDINNYETVSKKLTDIINNMSPTRKTGELYKIKDEITKIKLAVREGEEIKNSITEMASKKNIKKSETESINGEILNVQKEIEALSATNDLRLIKEKYNHILEGVNDKQNKLNELKEKYKGVLPEIESLDENIDLAQEYKELSKKLELYTLDEEEKLRYEKLYNIYGVNGYDEEVTKDIVEEWYKRNDKLKELTVTAAKYEAKELLAKERKETVINQKTESGAVKSDSKGINSKIAKLITGLTLLVIGIIVFTTNTPIGIIGILMGGVVTITALIGGKKDKVADNLDNSDDTKQVEKVSEETIVNESIDEGEVTKELSLEEELVKLKNDIEAGKEQVANIEDRITRYISIYIAEDILLERFHDYIRIIDKSYMEYQKLASKDKHYRDITEQMSVIDNRINVFYDEYGLVAEEDKYLQLTTLKKYIRDYDTLNRELEDAIAVKKKFELENDKLVEAINLSETNDDGTEQSLTSLTNKQTELTDKLYDLRKSIVDYDRQINAYAEKYDSICEQENELAGLLEKQEQGIRKYNNLIKTKEYLEKAKESFTSKYMQPIMTGFEKYVDILSKESDKKYKIDSHTEVTLEEKGMQRSVKFLSEGYKDMVGICMRMALVDAMYQDEKPFVVFDDPFVNLDDEKSKQGMEFLKTVSKEYQTIYFTCHSSRK